MILRIKIFLLIIFITHNLTAQKHDHNWVMGEFRTASQDSAVFGLMEVDMTELVPQVQSISFNVARFSQANSSFSSNEEKLLAYTNGIGLFNLQGDVIEGLDDFCLGDFSDASDTGVPIKSNTFIISDHEKENEFMLISGNIDIFSISGVTNAAHTKWSFFKIAYEEQNDSIVVFNLMDEGGFNQDTTSIERTYLTKHANGRDWWILFNYHQTNNYLKVLITSEGFINVDTQTIGTPTVLGIDQPTFSPDGQYYAAYSLNGQTQGFSESTVEYMHFDRCSGALSDFNKIVLTDTGQGLRGGVAFSPNSRFMYVTVGDSLFQFDMQAVDVEASKTMVAVNDGFTYYGPDSTLLSTAFNIMQIAPNNKIYISTLGFGKYMHVIDQPDSLGMACNVLQHAIELPRYYFGILPNFPNYRLKSLIGSSCDTLRPLAAFVHDSLSVTTFTDLSDRNPTEWYWTFGDDSTSTEQNPTHQYTENGAYEVCLIASNQSGSDTICQMIDIIVTSTEDLVNTNLFKIFPNPTSNYFGIQSSLEISSIEVYSNDGKLLLSSKTRQVPVRNLSSGLYLVKVHFENGRVGFGKVVRE